jgi:putative phosphoribosyl transferase
MIENQAIRQGDARFHDRRDAGRRLAGVLATMELADPVVLALPRGGVPVAFEVARGLNAPLDLLMVRKIGAPGFEEYGIGAVVDGADPQVVLNDEAVASVHPPSGYVELETQRQLQEIERRRSLYLGERQPVSVARRTAVVVDDGVATGGTARAALLALKKAGARRVILAVPVAPPDVIADLAKLADDVVCLKTPPDFRAVGLYYNDFKQTDDREVIDLLRESRVMLEREALAGLKRPPHP